MVKNPQYGQNQALEYLQSNCSDYDTLIMDFRERLDRINEVLQQRLLTDQAVWIYLLICFPLLVWFHLFHKFLLYFYFSCSSCILYIKFCFAIFMVVLLLTYVYFFPF